MAYQKNNKEEDVNTEAWTAYTFLQYQICNDWEDFNQALSNAIEGKFIVGKYKQTDQRALTKRLYKLYLNSRNILSNFRLSWEQEQDLKRKEFHLFRLELINHKIKSIEREGGQLSVPEIIMVYELITYYLKESGVIDILNKFDKYEEADYASLLDTE